MIPTFSELLEKPFEVVDVTDKEILLKSDPITLAFPLMDFTREQFLKEYPIGSFILICGQLNENLN